MGGLLVAGLLFSGAAHIFAAGKADTGSAAGKPIELTVWMGSWWEAQIPVIVEAYKKVAPNVNLKVEALPINNYVDNATTAILGGGGPDLLAIDAYFIGPFVDKGLFLTWDDQIKGLDLSDFAGVIKAGQFNGKYYAIPYRCSGSVMYYNKGMFDAAGLPYPQEGWNWDDLLVMARKLTKGDQQFGYGIAGSAKDAGNVFETLNPIIYAFGGSFLNDAQTKVTLNDPNTVKGFRFWTDLYTKEKVVPSGSINYSITADIMPLFADNKVAMFLSGDQGNTELKKYPNLDFGFVVPPNGPLGTGGYMWTVPVTAKHSDEAFAFAKWFLQPEVLGNLTIRIPARVSATKYGVWNEPIYQTLLRGALNGRLNPTIPQWNEMQQIIIAELQNIMQGKKTVEQGCDDMQRQCSALL